MYTATCDPEPLKAIPRTRWATFPWSDTGMMSAEHTASNRWAASREVIPLLWHHFEQANVTYGYPIALVELGSFKRYGGGAACPPHVDDPQPLSDGRLLSLSVVVDASSDLVGGELTVEESGGARSVELRPGDVAVFPSRSIHSVAPIAAGTRTVLVARALAADGFVASRWLWLPDGTPAHRCRRPTAAELRHYHRTLATSRSTDAASVRARRRPPTSSMPR